MKNPLKDVRAGNSAKKSTYVTGEGARVDAV
jgi:hypothetical protein